MHVGKVYDVTPFMDDHPGGGEIMLSAAGKDGTQDFEVGPHPEFEHRFRQSVRALGGPFEGLLMFVPHAVNTSQRLHSIRVSLPSCLLQKRRAPLRKG